MFIRLGNLVLLISVVFFSSGCHSISIPHDATLYNGHYYLFVSAELSWQDAFDKCESMGGTLAAIKSQGDNEFMVKLIDGKCVWLGATDVVTEGTWLWPDGTKAIYTNWQSHEPDNWYDGTEHALVFGWPGYPIGKWGDTRSFYQKQINGFVCQWD